MKFDEVTVKKILVDGNYVTADDIKKAEANAEEHRGSVIDYLIFEGLISKNLIGQAISESMGVPYANLSANTPTKEQTLLIPEDIAKKFHAVVSGQKKLEVTVTTDDPKNPELLLALKNIFKDKKVKINFALEEEIDELFVNYEVGLETKFIKIVESKGKSTPEVVDQIIEDALLLKASDVHCEPQEKEVVFRFRIDGVLHEAGRMPKEYYENIVNRFKVLAKLRIDEHFSSQDGAIRFNSKEYDEPVDLRVSVIPTLDGEKVAIRILSSYIEDLTLSNLGLSQELQEQILVSAHKPFGMILVTGPTGSGKTTTLYSLLRVINTNKINITTIEDPVEYKISGINQIQANSQTNLTFAKGLRAIARQDPNVILVGEIRDLETADIAVNAALTGHLLLSTFHSNNAATAIPRFMDMGIESFMLGSTIELIISQRLTRKICNACKISYTASKKDLDKFGPEVSKYFTDKSIVLYKGKGCGSCTQTGYKGRVGIFEYIVASPDLQDLISKNPSTKDVTTLVRSQGFKSMFEDGIEKVKGGITTLDELLRVVNP